MLAPIERVDLTELIGNLLDNAMRHAATRVRVSCDDGAGRLLVTIEDDGPGLDPDLEARVRQRGKRLDNGGAAGLGLAIAIAQDILDAYGWNMEFSRSPLGGLRVRLGAVSSA
jgi:signal transduction histidine kinase